MNRVETLISDLCPDGVPVFPLGDIGTTVSGLRGKSKDDFSDGNAPYVSYVEIFDNAGIDFIPERRVKVGSAENQSAIQLGDVLVTGSSETRNECGMTAVVTSNPELPIYLNSFCFIWRPNKGVELDPQFAKHLFRGRAFRDRVIETANGVTRQNISKPKFLAIEIPLPPLAVQREVASILNKFIELEAELEAELDARESQYEHYRNRLFSFEDGDVRWLPMGDICEMSWGNTSITKASYIDSKDGFLAYSASGPDGLLPHYEFDRDAVILSAIGARCGKTYFASGKWTCIKNTMYFFSRDAQVLDKYLFWYTNREEFWPRSTSAQPFISLGDVRNLEVPVPDLATQQKIVDAMDKLDTLISNISVGLPAEIAARRQQYDYYRSKLLNFKKLEVS